MVYILFNGEKIHGTYQTLQLLKANCYIFAYDLFRKNKLRRDIYFEIKDKILKTNVIELSKLQKIVMSAGMSIESHPLQENGYYVLENITKHIIQRFDKLEDDISKDARVIITFPGNSAIDNMMITSEIEDIWRNLDSENYTKIINELRKLIMLKIQRLQLKFPERIKFGSVSDKEASLISYQVWPADIGNWNLPNNSKIFGEGFALCFEYQVPGVFGIVINPLYGYEF